MANPQSTEERIELLEENYDRVYHELELLNLYIPKLCDILIRYWGASNTHRGEITRDINALKNYTVETRKTALTLQEIRKPSSNSNIGINKIILEEDFTSGDTE